MSLLAGTVVTVVAGLLPAIRASRVTPIAAMREGVSLREARTPGRGAGASGLAIIAAAVLVRVIIEASSAPAS